MKITAKCHAHFQTLTNTPAKFRENLDKLKQELRSQGTHCLHALLDDKPKMTKLKLLNSYKK